MLLFKKKDLHLFRDVLKKKINCTDQKFYQVEVQPRQCPLQQHLIDLPKSASDNQSLDNLTIFDDPRLLSVFNFFYCFNFYLFVKYQCLLEIKIKYFIFLLLILSIANF